MKKIKKGKRSFITMTIGIAMLFTYAVLYELHIFSPQWIPSLGAGLFFIGSFWHFSKRG